MKILVACIHFCVSSGRYITRALRRLGHDVKTVGPAPGRMIWGIELEKQYEWQPSVVDDTADLKIVASKLDGWEPDLIITADSAYTLHGAASCPHVLWGMDNHVRDYRLDTHWDAMFLAHSWGMRINEPNAHWLPPCYDPEAHTNLSRKERDFDVAMVGYPYDERVKILQAMRAAGLNVFASIGAVWEVYNAIYSRAKLALVKSVNGDLTQRFLENMAQGCCVLADRVPDIDKLGFVSGIDYWPYESTASAVVEARYLLNNNLYHYIARRGSRKVQPHTWDARATTLFKRLGEMGILKNESAGISVFDLG